MDAIMEHTAQIAPNPGVETTAAKRVTVKPLSKTAWIEEESSEEYDTGKEYEATDEDESEDMDDSDDMDELDDMEELLDENESGDGNKPDSEAQPGSENESDHENESGDENKPGDENEPGNENESGDEKKPGLEDEPGHKNELRNKWVFCDEYEPTDKDEPSSRGITEKSLARRKARWYQSTTELLIHKLPFQRLVREIIHDCVPEKCRHEIRMQSSAIGALQEASEAYLVEFFHDANYLAAYSKRDKLQRSDMVITRNLRAQREPWLTCGGPLEYK